MKWRFLRAVACLLASQCGPIFAGDAVQEPNAAPSGAKPNIVYVLVDDLGYEDVGFMGSKQISTPNIDKLANGGTILKSFYVQPVCSPTRAALMTGRHATRTGVYHIVKPGAPWGLPLAERTLAEALRALGYLTGIVGKWHLGEFETAYRPTKRGFDRQYGPWFGAVDHFTHKRENSLDWHRDDLPCRDTGYSTHLLAKEACRLIREKPDDKPLFLYVPFNAVHAPYKAPARYVEPLSDLKGERRRYASMIVAVDEAVGQIVAALEEKGIYENTIIVFSSDNGGPAPNRVTSNRPLRGGKGTIYEGGIRSCAFVHWPGRVPAGKVVDEPLHAIDWYPTLVKLAGGTLEQKLPLDGQDVWPALTKGAKASRPALFLPGLTPTEAALRKGHWILLHWDGKQELYDLAADLGQKQNLAATQPDKLNELRADLEPWLKSAVPSGDPSAKARKK